MIDRRKLLATGPAAALLSGELARSQTAPAGAAPPTLDELVRAPDLSDAAISPDGTRLAVVGGRGEGKARQALVALTNLPNDGGPPLSINLGDLDVEAVEWAKNDRLLIWVNYWKDKKGKPTGIYVGRKFYSFPIRRVISVDVKGADPVVLFSDEEELLSRSFNAASLVSLLPNDPRRVLMQAWEPSRDVLALYHVDVYTGAAQPMELGMARTFGWVVQNGVPILRFDSDNTGSSSTVHARPLGATGWKLIRRVRRDALRKLPDFDVVGTTIEPGVLLVRTTTDQDAAAVVREFDIRSLAFGKVVASHKDFDISGIVQDENLSVVASSYVDDRLTYVFSDPQLARRFRGVTSYFSNRCNVAIIDVSRDRQRFLLHVSGPQDPGSFHLYDLSSASLSPVGAARPWLKPERLAPMRPLKVLTRDGVPLSCYLTLPIAAGSAPPPLVVMPHGGPETRDHQSYDVFVQALAAQGWAVLQPNFRGSFGFGKAFADAGRRRWGDRMQEDLEDAVAQVIADGQVDPRRIAIFGLSYGGYAALMGAVRRPELYKAVVAGAGVSDLLEMLAFVRREDGYDSPAYEYWRKTIGDPRADEAMLKQASPARRVAEIKAPVLLIHGTRDDIVTPKQSTIMAEALKAGGKTHELVELEGEGHSGWSDANRKLVLERVVRFIGASI